MSAPQLTRKTDEFARHVKGTADLPQRLRAIYLAELESGPCHSSVYAPPISALPRRHQQPIAGYLLLNFDDYLLLGIDRAERAVERVQVPLADLICVEFGQALLFSWLKIVFGTAALRQVKIPFNTVGAGLFITSLNLIRAGIDQPVAEDENFTCSGALSDFKFRNLLDDWLRPNEVLLGVAFQAEVRKRRLVFLERQASPPFLAALTNRQFLTITEEPARASERTGQFSQIYNYCPHLRIESVQIEPKENEDAPAEFHLVLRNKDVRNSIKSKLTAPFAPGFQELIRLTNHFVVRHQLQS